MKLTKTYRGFPKGYILKSGEVSKAQLDLMKKRGVLEDAKPLPKSGEFTVAKVKEKVSGMDFEEAFAFTKGDERKTVQKLRDELLRSTR